jgi:hypothetical protein
LRKTLDQRRTPSTGWGKLELRPPLGADHVLRLGADWRVAEGHLEEDAYSAVTGLVTARRQAGGRNSDLGLYLEDDWTLGALVLTAGLRADRWTIREGFFTEANAAGTVTTDNRFAAARAGTRARGGAVWQAALAIASRVGPAGFACRRSASFTVLSWCSRHHRANAALENEDLLGFEAGINWAPSPVLTFAITAFDNTVSQAVANVTIAPSLRERRNVDAVHARGVEISADMRFGQFGLDAACDHRCQGRAGGLSAALNKRAAPDAALCRQRRRAGPRQVGCFPPACAIPARNMDDLETDLLPAARAGCCTRSSACWPSVWWCAPRTRIRRSSPQSGGSLVRRAAHFLGRGQSRAANSRHGG